MEIFSLRATGQVSANKADLVGWGACRIWWGCLEIRKRCWRSCPWLGVPTQNAQYMTERVRAVIASSDDKIGTSGREAPIAVADWAY